MAGGRTPTSAAPAITFLEGGMVTGIIATDEGEPGGAVGKLMAETDTHLSSITLDPHKGDGSRLALGFSDGTRLVAYLDHAEVIEIIASGLARGVIFSKTSTAPRG